MTKAEHEAILERLTNLERRQTELGAKVATLALLLSEQDTPSLPPPPSRKTPPGVATERWRAMQRIAFEVGAEFGKTRADLAELRKKYGR